MSTDRRYCLDSEQTPVDAEAFLRDLLPSLLDAHQGRVVPGASALPLQDLCIETEGKPFTLLFAGDRVSIKEGHHGAARVLLSAEQLSDIVTIKPLRLPS